MNQLVAVQQPQREASRGVQAIVPQDYGQVCGFAEMIHASGLAPSGINTKEKIAVAIFHGLEIGLTPMAALQSIAVVNGRPSIWGDAGMALVRASGLAESIKEVIVGTGDERTATCTAKRKGEPEPIIGTFSVADARRAGLWNKSGPWQQYPDRMLKMRARAFALRDGFADVLRGLAIAEEQQDATITASKAEAAATLPPAPPPPPPEDDFPSAAAAPASSHANVRAPSAPEHTADRRAASSSQEQPATHPASFDDVLKLADQHLAKVSDQPALHEAWQRFWKEGLMKWKEVAKADQPRAMEVLSKHKARLAKTGEVQSPDTGFTITKLVAELDAALARCRDRASLSDTYTKIVQPLIEAGTISDEHVNGPLGVVFTQHSERIEEIEDVPMEEPPPAEEDDGFPGDR